MATRANMSVTPAEAKALTPKPEADTEASVITKAIMGVYDAFAQPQFASDDAAEAAVGNRERLMLEAAQLSIAGKWDAKHFVSGKTGDVLDAALAKWSEGKNRLPTTLAQFKVELRRAVHPSARAYVQEAYHDTKVAWEAERTEAAEAKAAGEKHDAPLMKAFAKRYHMWVGSKGVLQAHIDADDPKASKRLADNHDDASDPHTIAGTRQTAERTDPKAAARVIAKLVKALEAIRAEFPIGELDEMLEIANSIEPNAFANVKAKAAIAAAREAKAKERAARRNTPAVAGATPGKAKAIENALDDLTGE